MKTVRLVVAGLTLAALLAVGCGSEAATDSSPPDDVPTTVAAPRGGEPPAGTAEAGAPGWYVERPRLDSCGLDAEYTDRYPNTEARECFRQAYENGVPGELTTVTYGDEGETLRAHFRVLGPGSYEIVGEWTPAPHEASGGFSTDVGWSRWVCDRFVFLDDPGYEVDGVPMVNAEGECEQVEQVPG